MVYIVGLKRQIPQKDLIDVSVKILDYIINNLVWVDLENQVQKKKKEIGIIWSKSSQINCW